MKRILFLANHSGGLYDFRKDLIASLRNSCEVIAVTPKNDRWEELNQIANQVIELPIDRRGLNPLNDATLFFCYWRILKKIRPDLVITYTIKPNIYGGLACRLQNIPYAVNITGLGSAIENGGLLKKFIFFLYRISLKRAKVVFFENSKNEDMFISAGIVSKRKSVKLNGAGVNLNDFTYQPYPEEDSIRFIFVGRVMHEKGIDEFFFAAKQLKQRYGDQVSFHIFGSFEEAYKPIMDKLERSKTVQYHGYQSDMKLVYAFAHCVVLPSYHEGMSNVLLEAAASGRPLITSDIPGCREAVLPGESGILCPVRDPQALTDALAEFMECPAEKRKEMGRASRRLMEERFEKSAVVRKTLEALEI